MEGIGMQKLVLAKGISWVLVLLMMVMGVFAVAQAGEHGDGFEPLDSYGYEHEDEEPPVPIYALVFLDFGGELLVEEKLAEGERIIRPFFVPTLAGRNFLFWFDVNEFERTDKIVEFEFGKGIYKDTVLVPYYEEVNGFEPEDSADSGITLPWDTTPIGKLDANTNVVLIDNPNYYNEGLYFETIKDTVGNPNYNDGLYFDVVEMTVAENDPLHNDGLYFDIIDIIIIEEDDDAEEVEDEADEEADEEIDEEEADEEEVEIDEEALEDDELEKKNAAASAAGYAIHVFTSHDENIEEGTPIRVWAEFVGFSAEEATLQWQYSADGAQWIEVPGATGMEHVFEATSASVNYSWRLLAKVEVSE